MTTVRAFAAAKINLTLHITGQRADGYHLLDSLVMFADVGDHITVTPASKTTLEIGGPMAAGLSAGPDNLVVRAADLIGVTGDIHLEKNLPVASGMGGGSADAAACLRALSQLGEVALPDELMATLGATLGADVPVCLASAGARMSGIGEQVTPVSGLPELYAVLVNPRVGVSTPEVFKALKSKDKPAMQGGIPANPSRAELITWLGMQRNDLEEPALTLQPVIGDVLQALRALAGAQISRMSGSGASCFALFESYGEATKNAAVLRKKYPHWWVEAARLN